MGIKQKIDQGLKQAKQTLATHKKAFAIAGAIAALTVLGLGATTLTVDLDIPPASASTLRGGAAKKAGNAEPTGDANKAASKGDQANPSAEDAKDAKPEDAKTKKGEANKSNAGKEASQGGTVAKAPANSSDSGKKPGHQHVWKDHTTTVETWIIDVVPVYEEREVLVGYKKTYTEIGIHCNCGQIFLYTDPGYSERFREHSVAHILADEPSNYWTEATWIEDKNQPIYDTEREQVGTEDRSHYETETIVDYRYCDCGARQ